MINIKIHGISHWITICNAQFETFYSKNWQRLSEAWYHVHKQHNEYGIYLFVLYSQQEELSPLLTLPEYIWTMNFRINMHDFNIYRGLLKKELMIKII